MFSRKKVILIGGGSDNIANILAGVANLNLDNLQGLVVNSILYGRINDTAIKPLMIDGMTHLAISLDHPHHEIHNGGAYTATKKFAHGTGASPNILIVTPDTTKWIHFVFQGISNNVLEATLYEVSDYENGASLIAINRNRNSTNISNLTLTTDAIDGGGGKGNPIWTFKAGAHKTVTASTSDRFEFILKQNTKYLLELAGGNGDLITVLLDWYGFTSKH